MVPVQHGYDNKLVIPLTVCLSCTCGFTFILCTALALSSTHVQLMYALSFTDIGASAQWTLQWKPELKLRTLLSSTQSQTALRKVFYTTWTPLVTCVHTHLNLHRVPSHLLPWQHHGWLSTGLSPPQPSLLATRASPLATREPCRLKYICVPRPPPLQRLSLCPHGCPTTRSSATSSQAVVSHRPPSHLTWNLRLRLQQPMNPRRLRFNLLPFFYCNQD